MKHERFLTDAQLQAELDKCEFCEEKPCLAACPANCSPADFIMAARNGEPHDIRRAAQEIMMNNPLGGVCGLVCPDRHCKNACVHKGFDGPVEIPSVQATLVQKAKELGAMPRPALVTSNGRRIAVVGAGPAGLGAAALLCRHGFSVVVFDEKERAGGACTWIPEHRLPAEVLQSDIDWLLSLGDIRLELGSPCLEPQQLLEQGFEGVILAAGLTEPFQMGIEGEELGLVGLAYLADPAGYPMNGNLAVIGGGATAVDCAVTARQQGAARVEMLALERWDEMPLEPAERRELQDHGIDVSGRIRVTALARGDGGKLVLTTEKITLPAGVSFNLRDLQPVPGTKAARHDFDHLVIAIGARRSLKPSDHPRVVLAGDFLNGPSSVVSAVASGKNAAMQLLAAMVKDRVPSFEPHTKSTTPIPGSVKLPVPLEADFFGRAIPSPFLLSAAPPSDGYEQVCKAYERGWAGAVMKTSFDGVPIHIPGRYMHQYTPSTYGNCDNVSGHPLDRVCREVERLVARFPDRLTIASTGGPVSGDDRADQAVWQSNTRKIEAAGAMGIEYSLSCPQGGDGTEGDIVSQNAALTAKIIDWILQAGDPAIPKLFKLTGAVTSIAAIAMAVKEVFARYPSSKAGITLANTFPSLDFRQGDKEEWEEGILFGMSGEGIAPISNLTLANVAHLGVVVSGNGGPLDHKSAAHFLALGARTVQFCTAVMKYGYGVVDHLHSGLSFLMAERGIRSVNELIGRALPNPIRDFMALSPVKQISQVTRELCQHCGNCTRCPYLAITLDEEKIPSTDPARCIGCSICVQKCFAGALYMRDRTPEESALLQES
ncbi:MAG: FAD-dependent oxidoreductase [Bradymonadales bacterium]|nr:FAD-dependent oxidoreductase [Bradymonadales bacterium]